MFESLWFNFSRKVGLIVIPYLDYLTLYLKSNVNNRIKFLEEIMSEYDVHFFSLFFSIFGNHLWLFSSLLLRSKFILYRNIIQVLSYIEISYIMNILNIIKLYK